MFEYLKAKLVELSPTHAIMDNNGLAYFINISLNTYSQLKEGEQTTLFLQQIVREDAHLLFGFADKAEREVFKLLITVSGIGANTARMMLSSLSTAEIKSAIETGNVNVLKSVKGIGLKTAQRVIIDLKDKIGKTGVGEDIFASSGNTKREEALTALVMLGFNKPAIEKVLDKITSESTDLSVEELIKFALKRL
jgi:Holliday junction DNA helicase RuvA